MRTKKLKTGGDISFLQIKTTRATNHMPGRTQPRPRKIVRPVLNTAAAIITAYAKYAAMPTELEYYPDKRHLQHEIKQQYEYPYTFWRPPHFCLHACLMAARHNLRRNPDEARRCYTLAMYVRQTHLTHAS